MDEILIQAFADAGYLRDSLRIHNVLYIIVRPGVSHLGRYPALHSGPGAQRGENDPGHLRLLKRAAGQVLAALAGGV